MTGSNQIRCRVRFGLSSLRTTHLILASMLLREARPAVSEVAHDALTAGILYLRVMKTKVQEGP
jgi:hypothetical protein